MLKSVFGGLGRGFLYTIGRILAYFFIGFVIYTLISRFPTDTSDLIPLMRGGIF